ncbi:TNF receptor-associated factor 3 isoform X2 [Macrobrachium rosenbergii]|uniref:TNF receptor-associated factor 3 isoform X2 n=1 Tax=Macrobrachium rosenbergii TaxID=79674 RepID=UPI0034D39ACC
MKETSPWIRNNIPDPESRKTCNLSGVDDTGPAQSTGSDVQSLSYCRISTRDLIATAQSTANRVLQGVCNPRELNDRFVTLEKQIADQFNVLKTMVLNIEDQLRTQDKQSKKHHGKLRQAIRAIRGRPTSRADGLPGDSSDYAPEEAEEEDDYRTDYGMPGEEESPRLSEIYRYNSTIHQEEGHRVFTYYWRVNDINYKMTNWGWRRSLRSESFYIFQNGYRMYMRIFPNQGGENVYIHVGLTTGEYDSDLEWPFKLKHRIKVIDHGYPTEDLTSRVWDPTQLCSGWNWRRPEAGDNYECVGLGFEQKDLRTRNYIHDDSIVVKLTVFLAA